MQQSRPALVRVRIWRTDQTVPYEAVIELPPIPRKLLSHEEPQAPSGDPSSDQE